MSNISIDGLPRPTLDDVALVVVGHLAEDGLFVLQDGGRVVEYCAVNGVWSSVLVCLR